MQKVKPQDQRGTTARRPSKNLFGVLLLGWLVLASSCEAPDSAITKRLKGIAPRNGLVGEWLLNGTLNDTAGTNNGIVKTYGSGQQPTYVTGRKGKPNEAMALMPVDTTSNFTDITLPLNDPAMETFSGSQSVTMSVWFNTTSGSLNTTGSGRGPFENQPGYGYFQFALGFENYTVLAGVGQSGVSGENVASTTISGSQWHHAVMVYDASARTLTLYLDGIAYHRNTADYSAVPASTDALGGRFVLGVVAYEGAIQQARLYNRALTSDEVSALFHE